MKKTISLALCLFVASLSLAYDFSYTYSGQTLYYNIISSTNHTVEVTQPSSAWSGYTKPTGYLYIPSTVSYGGTTYSVVSIGSFAFSSCSGITSVSIPSTVTSIESFAFYWCTGLTYVSIPNSVTSIGNFAFDRCSGLSSITIPSSVTSIGANPFEYCSGLNNIYVNSGNTVYDSRNSCNAIIKKTTNKLISGCKNTSIPSSVTSIGEYAFYGCTGMTSISIPSSVTSIENDAFSYCTGLTSITIPSSVTYIGTNPLGRCTGLNSIYVNSNNSVYDSRNNCNAIIKSSTNQLIAGCKNTSIPSSVTSIGEDAFYGCTGLTSITIPSSVTSIGSYAFSCCSGLTSVSIPNSVITIRNDAFGSCTGLTSVILGDNIDSIEYNAFFLCNNLNTVYCYADTPPVFYGYSTSSTFGYCDHVVNKLIVRCSSVSSYSAWASYFNQITCVPFYTLTVLTNNIAYGYASGGGSYAQNATATLSATANNGYHFVRWTDGNTSNPRNVTVTSDMTYTAVFASNNCTITVNSNNSDWGTVSGGGNYQYGQTATLTATSASHYHFERWSDGNTLNPRTISVIEDLSLTAFFAIDSHNITVNTTNPDWCNVTGAGSHEYGSVVTISVSPTNSHYHFDEWEDGSTVPSRTITVLCDTTLYAYFSSDQYNVSATSADPSMGFVTGDGSYDYGSSATITAYPLTGYKFLHWNDGNTNSSRTFIVNQDCEFVAYFGPLQGIDEVQDSEQIIHVFPNPANNVVTLQLQGMTGNAQLTVTDMLGREVMCKQLQGNGISFSVAGWSPDIYLLKITFGDGSSAVRKLTVTH
ncbi:MAG: leucine-rich repeat protein [Bacteroidales bacterium]|nr:leucine-rich repeat protein [Bacteroidales bacterium]